MFRNILIPVDGSEGSKLALNRGSELVDHGGVEQLTLLTVAEIPKQLKSYTGKLAVAYREMEELLKHHAEEILQQAQNQFADKRLKVKTKFVWGEPPYAIMQEAREGQYDLIIMGSRGLGGVERLLLGSVSNRVVQEAPCTVMIARPPTAPPKSAKPWI